MKIVLSLLVVLSFVSGMPRQALAGPRDLLAQADDDHFWIARVQAATDGQTHYEQTRLTWREMFDPNWISGPTVPARVVSMASASGQLLVVLTNGQWMIATPEDLRLGAPPPAGGLLLAIAAEQKDVWAIVSVAPTTQPTTTASTRPALMQADRSGSATAATAAGTRQAADEHEAGTESSALSTMPSSLTSTKAATQAGQRHILLFHLHGGEWTDPQPLPLGISEDPSRLSLAIAAQQPVVAWLESDNVLMVYRGGAGVPLALQSIRLSAAVTQFKLLTIQDHACLWVQTGGHGARAVSSTLAWVQTGQGHPATDPATAPDATSGNAMAAGFAGAGDIFAGDDFSRSFPLSISQAIATNSPQVVAIAPSRLHWIAEVDGQLRERAYDFDYQPRTEMITIAQDRAGAISLEVCLMAAVGLVLFASAAGAAQRQARVATEAPAPEQLKLQLAAPGARIAAGMVDLLPVAAAVTMIIQAMPARQIVLPPSRIMCFVLGLALITHILHTLISEWVCGQSIGKMLLGLRVVATDGKAATPRGIILRNVLRIADYAVLPLALIAITPLRQRLGDMAGKTVVIAIEIPERREEEEPEQSA